MKHYLRTSLERHWTLFWKEIVISEKDNDMLWQSHDTQAGFFNE